MPAAKKAEAMTPRRVDIEGTADSLDLSTMGGRIAWSRIRKELRQEDVANKLGLSRATIVQYERDKIMPPIPAVERLAKALDTSPEFLAFGRQGVEGRGNASQDVVTMHEVSVGGQRGLFRTGEFAMPRKFFEDRDINVERSKMLVLDHDENEFDFYKKDRLIMDQSATDITDKSRQLFFVKIGDNKPTVMRREGMTQTGKVKLIDGAGKTHMFAVEDVTVLGAINGVLGLV